ncbi:MAG: hypothetical protein FOGNACKC_01736 [Anaerolineae bacterium]|nr:hypothetical protein [Anaerolineae bacterium]
MIHFNPTTHTFNLGLNSSFYAFQVDAEGRLVHLGWGPRPAGADDALLGGQITGPDESTPFEQQPRRDELITFGDVTYHEVSLGASQMNWTKPNWPNTPALMPFTSVFAILCKMAICTACSGWKSLARRWLRLCCRQPGCGHNLQFTIHNS